MKKNFDRFSKRGVIVGLISAAGLIAEILLKEQPDPFILILYGLVLMLGIALVLWIKAPPT